MTLRWMLGVVLVAVLALGVVGCGDDDIPQRDTGPRIDLIQFPDGADDGYIGSIRRAPDSGWRFAGLAPLIEQLSHKLSVASRLTLAAHFK